MLKHLAIQPPGTFQSHGGAIGARKAVEETEKELRFNPTVVRLVLRQYLRRRE